MSGSGSTNGSILSQSEDLRLVCSYLVRLMEGGKLCRLFHKIVSQVYTIDASPAPENKITGILAPTADRILEMFLSQDDDIGLPFEALFYACFVTQEIFETRDNGLQRSYVVQAESWCEAALTLAETIVRVRYIVRLLILLIPANYSPDSTGFELQIYRQLKLLNSLLSLRASLQKPVFSLLKTLLSVPQPENREQPSILAHLGGDENLHIPLIKDIVTDPLMYPETRVAVWRYAASVMASQQQGLAILLLFGADTGRKTANKPAIVEDKEERDTLLRKAIRMIVEDDLKFTDILDCQVFGNHM